jgi:orotate phosphoribosyltransferase
MARDDMRAALLQVLVARMGHFQFESGFHGNLWLDLDALFLRPARLRPFVDALATRLAPHTVDVICGPMTGGAFLTQMIAAVLDVECCYAERIVHPSEGATAAVTYHIPDVLRGGLRGQSVAIVDDVINAGFAVRETATDVTACGANLVAIGALLVLGDAAARLAAEVGVPLESLAALANPLWEPATCPLCASGVPLETP